MLRLLLLPLAALAASALAINSASAQSTSDQTQAPAQQSHGNTLPLHEMLSRSYHVTHYLLRVTVDMAHKTLIGEETVDLTPYSDGFTTLDLDAAQMTFTRVTLAGQNVPLPFHVFDDHIGITLDHAYHAGDPIEVTIDYTVVRPQRGAWFIDAHPDRHTPAVMWTQGEAEDNHYWFPCYDYPNDKATSEIYATVDPKDMTISNGKLVSQTTNASGTRTDHWVESATHATYLTSLIVGPYEKVTDHVGDLEVSYYGYQGDSARLRATFGMTPSVLQFYQSSLGVPFPYEKYSQTVVPDFIYGGMENISATTQTDSALHGALGDPDDDSTGLAAHELAHQWFGDLVTCRDWADAWLNEGFATYFPLLYTEHTKGEGEFEAAMRNTQRGYLYEDANRWRHPMVDFHYNVPMDLFTAHIYNKGAAVLNMLRYVVGDSGFWASMHRYLTDHAYGDVDTEDLRRACEAATGQSLGWFFDEWAYNGGYPSFAVSDSYDASAKTVSITIAETQKEDPVTKTLAVYRMPVDIEVMTGSGNTTQRVEITQAQQTLVLPCGSEPCDVIFDPKGWLLKTVEFPKGQTELIWQLRHAEDVGPRLDAIDGLAADKDQPAVETALATTLETDASPAVRAACPPALAGMTVGSPESALLAEGRIEADISVREAIVRALGSYSDASAKAEVALALADPHYGLQEAAIDAVGAQKNTSLLPALRAVIAGSNTDSAYGSVRAAAVRVLLAQPGPQQIADARRYAGADQPRMIRMTAIRSLSTIAPGDRTVTAFLVHLLSDPNPLVRRVAVASLANRKDPSALPALNALAADPHTDARLKDAATSAVQAIEGSKAAPAGPDTGGMRKQIENLQQQVDRLTKQDAALKAQVDSLSKAGATPSPETSPAH